MLSRVAGCEGCCRMLWQRVAVVQCGAVYSGALQEAWWPVSLLQLVCTCVQSACWTAMPFPGTVCAALGQHARLTPRISSCAGTVKQHTQACMHQHPGKGHG